MSKDPFLYILIGILILNVLKFVSLQTVTYAFMIYMAIIFIQGLRKKPEE